MDQSSQARALPDDARLFQVVAVAEAWSWVGLLVGMYVKYSSAANPIGVRIMGPIHGLLFVAYLVAAWRVAHSRGWPRSRLLWSLAAAFPPLATWIFERIALRRGWLSAPRAAPPPQ
jgi:integral membrane protein